MKKKICLLLTSIVLFSALPINFAFANGIKVTVNGENVDFDVQPQIINDRTMVPMRAIFEKLGATVEWNNSTKTITGKKDDTVIEMTIGDPDILVNNRTVTLDVPAAIVDGRTLVPTRAVAESFSCDVNWYSATRTVVITDKKDISVPVEEEIIKHEPVPYIFALSDSEVNKALLWGAERENVFANKIALYEIKPYMTYNKLSNLISKCSYLEVYSPKSAIAKESYSLTNQETKVTSYNIDDALEINRKLSKDKLLCINASIASPVSIYDVENMENITIEATQDGKKIPFTITSMSDNTKYKPDRSNEIYYDFGALISFKQDDIDPTKEILLKIHYNNPDDFNGYRYEDLLNSLNNSPIEVYYKFNFSDYIY